MTKTREDIKGNVILGEYRVENTAETDFPDTYDNEKDAWSHENFKKKFQVAVVKLDKLEIEFDLIGLHCSIANAIRRIMLSEVPSMAIEKVFIANNTTLVKDEVLAHRLGLIPLRADPRLFDYRTVGVDEPSEQDTLEFELKIKCIVNTEGNKNSTLPDEMYKNHSVYSKHLKWIPLEGQAGMYKEKNIRPFHSDILLNKLRPGHELDLKVHAVKGIGKDHAKFSPVGTAYYRMLPKITLLREIRGAAAELLQNCFSPGVIGLEEIGDGDKRAVVIDARYDSCSRNIFRYDNLKGAACMSRIRDHFIFNIESMGAYKPEDIFLEAIDVLRKKCQTYKKEIALKKLHKK